VYGLEGLAFDQTHVIRSWGGPVKNSIKRMWGRGPVSLLMSSVSRAKPMCIGGPLVTKTLEWYGKMFWGDSLNSRNHSVYEMMGVRRRRLSG